MHRDKFVKNNLANTFERLSRLSELSMVLSSGLELPEILDKIVYSAKHAIDADEVYVMLLQPEKYELYLASCSGRPRKRPKLIKCPDRRISLSSQNEYGFAPYQIRKSSFSRKINYSKEDLSPEGLLVRNVFINKQKLMFVKELKDSLFENVPFNSAIILPLQTTTQTLGVMLAANIKKERAFSVNDMEEITIYANLAALMIEHYKLLKEREEKLREMEKLNLLAKRFSSAQTLEGLIGLSFEYLTQIIPHDLGVVILFNDDEESRYYVSNKALTPSSINNLSEHLNEIILKLRRTPAKLVKSQQLFLGNQELLHLGKKFRSKIQSFLTVPLTVHGVNIGLINLSSIKPEAFTRDHLRAFTTLANLLATSIENVKTRLYLERKIEETSVLFEISQTLTSTLVLDEVLDAIVNFSMEMMHALRCELRLLDKTGEYLEIKAARGLSQHFITSTPIKVGEGILGTVISTKKPISVVDARKDPRTKYLSLVKREKLAGLLAVPIMQRGNPIGVITVYTSKPRDFTQNEIDLLTTFASQASIAIENAVLYSRMKENYLSMVSALAAAIEAKDAYTHGHSQKVMEYAVKIAQKLKLPDDQIEIIKHAGLLHDIGKIGIRDEILGKNGPLTKNEMSEMQKHPLYGANIVEQVDFLKEISPLTLYHHEWYNGSGYPQGLKGEQIPLGARILAVADTFHAMISDRPYRKALPIPKAIKELKRVAGTQLDPKIVKVFLEVLKEEGLLVSKKNKKTQQPTKENNDLKIKINYKSEKNNKILTKVLKGNNYSENKDYEKQISNNKSNIKESKENPKS